MWGDKLHLLGLAANFSVLSAVGVPVAKHVLKGGSDDFWAPILGFVLAFCWMMLCDLLVETRSARKGEYDFGFLARVTFAPSAAVVLALCLLFVWLWLTNRN